MFLYNPSSGASYVEFANGSGGWTGGVAGPAFSAGWSVYPGNFNSDGLTDYFLYNPSSGASYVDWPMALRLDQREGSGLLGRVEVLSWQPQRRRPDRHVPVQPEQRRELR